MSAPDGRGSGDRMTEHAVDLLARTLPEDAAGAVHLDLACGSGAIADQVTARHGLTYIGVDTDRGALGSLTQRGYETHCVDLADDRVGDLLDKILDGRRVASVTMLGGLDHRRDGSHVLAALGDLISAQRAIAVVAVPNATHVDVGITMLFGGPPPAAGPVAGGGTSPSWSAAGLTTALLRAGLHRVAAHDLEVGRSDQPGPGDHVALSDATAVGQWLRARRQLAEPHALTTHFVWALAPVPPRLVEPDGDPERGPFLSVLMRTQGRRPQELREALLCLAAQSCSDFELLVIVHRASVQEQEAVQSVLDDQPASLRARTRLLTLDHGRRAAPLNLGLRHAAGRYVAIFDDDDLVLSHWVSSFLRAAEHNRGRILRGVTLRQEDTLALVTGLTGVVPCRGPEVAFAQDFSLTQHLVLNQSPPIGWVFPRSLHRDLGLTFDDSMTTTEDWDFLLRAAELCGVADIADVLAIYRWWEERETSRTAHPAAEWFQNEREIDRRVDSQPFLLPAGETRVLRGRLRHLEELEQQAADGAHLLDEYAVRVVELEQQLGASAEREETLRTRLQAERRRRARLTRRLGQADLEPPAAPATPPNPPDGRAPRVLRRVLGQWPWGARRR